MVDEQLWGGFEVEGASFDFDFNKKNPHSKLKGIFVQKTKILIYFMKVILVYTIYFLKLKMGISNINCLNKHSLLLKAIHKLPRYVNFSRSSASNS